MSAPPSRKPRRPPVAHRALMLRTCAADMSAHGGFVWPTEGVCVAPDWDPQPCCGYGLHGLLWGEGDGRLLSWADDASWLVCEIDAREVVHLDGKVKVPVTRTLRELDEAERLAMRREVNVLCRELGEPLRYPEAEPRGGVPS